MPAQPMIALAHVAKSFDGGATFAVRDASLAVAKGAFCAVVGQSGSGKSTLLKMLNRLVEPDRGEVRIDGARVGDGPAWALRRRIGYVFQGSGLFPHLSLAENIAVTPRLLGWRKGDIDARVGELLDLVGLPRGFGCRIPAELSGGQRQRVALARALAARPAVMLLDEPFGALDAITRDELAREYRRIHDTLELTTVMITHDMLEALLLADHIAVMCEGELLAQGDPGALNADDVHPYVRTLLDTPRRQAERVAERLGGLAHG